MIPATATSSEDLRFEVEAQIATITWNRPGKLNTVTPEMGKALVAIRERVNDDDEVRVVILTGSGERAFSAGSDVKVLDDYGSNWQMRNRTDYCRQLWDIRKPMIAAIRGYCIGGGLEAAMTCDIRYASPDAQFGAGEIKLGWHGGFGNTQFLPRLVGAGNASEMLLTGDLIDAAEAHRIGLIQKVCEPDELMKQTWDLAERIAHNAPIATQLTKHLVRVSEGTTLEMGLAYENDLFTFCFTTEDSKEGIQAFREKRPPQFRGR